MTPTSTGFQQLTPAFCARLLTLAAIGDLLRDDATIEVYLRVADTLAIDAAMGDAAAFAASEQRAERLYHFGLMLLQEDGMSLADIQSTVTLAVEAIQADPAGHIGAAMTKAIRRSQRPVDAAGVAKATARWEAFQTPAVAAPAAPTTAPNAADFPNLSWTRNRGPNLA